MYLCTKIFLSVENASKKNTLEAIIWFSYKIIDHSQHYPHQDRNTSEGVEL